MRFNPRDILTGLALAGLILPEGVAYAGIAGLAPGRALAAAVAGGLAYAIIGRSRFAVLSSTSSSAAILAATLGGLGSAGAPEPVRAALAAMIVALAGAIFLVLSLLRLGSLSSFISRPVLRGFAWGLAVTIIVKQLPHVLGVPASGDIWHILGTLLVAFSRWNWPGLALSLAALAALIGFRRAPQWPGALTVIVSGIAIGVLGRPENYGIALAGSVSLAMPHWQLPSLALLPRLVEIAAPIALILFAESWGTIRSLALKHGDAIDANRELGAIGAANIAAALVQGMPVGAGFSAGAANEAAGATDRLAAAVASVALLALALFAARWIARIPEPVLSAVVIAALTHALSLAPLRQLFRIGRDQWVMVGAALGVLALGVLYGMLAAIALSIALLLYDFARPAISELGQIDGSSDFVDQGRHGDAHAIPGVAIYRPNAPLFFANAESALHAIAARARDGDVRTVVLSLEESNDLDSTALEVLGEFAESLAKAQRRLILARAHDRVRDLLAAAGFTALASTSTYSVADAARLATTPPPPP
ncbi:MAG: SulP family inorganic anion transporter [Sphingomonadales bacterium]|nr:SulP family inorganic anion transporter [Sphingomonadales bacterium]